MLRAALIAIVLAASAEGATVRLKDGRLLTGAVVASTELELELFSQGKTTRIPVSDILSVSYEDPVPPAAASAVAAARKQQLGLNLGLSIPLGDVDFASIGGGSGANGDLGVDVGGHYLYFPRPCFGWGFTVDHLSRSGTDSPGLLPRADARISGGSVLLMGILKVVLLPADVVQPFVLVGAGAARTWTVVDARPRPGFEWDDTATDETRRLIDGRAWTPAGTLRLGLDFWSNEPTMFSLEAGWTAIGAATYAATGEGRALGLSGVSGPTHVVSVGGRWGWRF